MWALRKTIAIFMQQYLSIPWFLTSANSVLYSLSVSRSFLFSISKSFKRNTRQYLNVLLYWKSSNKALITLMYRGVPWALGGGGWAATLYISLYSTYMELWNFLLVCTALIQNWQWVYRYQYNGEFISVTAQIIHLFSTWEIYLKITHQEFQQFFYTVRGILFQLPCFVL